MLVELVMARYGWNEIWAPTIGDPDELPPGRDRHRVLDVFAMPGFYVGVWTGPDGDLLCVRRCETAADAERYKSPAGRTLVDATLRALLVRWSGDLAAHLQGALVRQWLRHHEPRSSSPPPSSRNAGDP